MTNDGCDGLVVRFSRIGDLPGLAPAERGDREIGLAVAVEVRRFDVGDARPAVEPERAELALRQAAHPDHGALGVIGREELAHFGDEQILHAVLVDVGERDVSRMRNARDLRESPARRPWIAAEDEPLAHVGAEHVELPVAVEVDEPHVRHRRSAGHSGDGHRPARERQRRPGGLRPGVRRGQTLRRVAHVERQHLLHVVRQLHVAIDDAGRAEGRRASFTDEHHPDELVAPVVARQDVGRGIRVAGPADRARLALGVCGPHCCVAGCAMTSATAAQTTRASDTAARPILRRCGRQTMPIGGC